MIGNVGLPSVTTPILAVLRCTAFHLSSRSGPSIHPRDRVTAALNIENESVSPPKGGDTRWLTTCFVTEVNELNSGEGR